MTRVDDVMLMAYADGELDAATARQIEAAIADDPALAERARVFRESASLLRGAYADALHEEVPERLLAAVRPAAQSGAVQSNVVSLSARRPSRQIISWAVAASLAALVLGGGGTYWFLTAERDGASGLQLASSDRWLDHVAGFYDVYDVTFKKEDRLLVDFKADDIPELAGTLHCALGLSPVAAGKLLGMDLDAVRAMPGVVRVITGEDIPGVNDCGSAVPDDPILCDGEIRFLGQPVFAVVAQTRDQARRAAASARSLS